MLGFRIITATHLSFIPLETFLRSLGHNTVIHDWEIFHHHNWIEYYVSVEQGRALLLLLFSIQRNKSIQRFTWDMAFNKGYSCYLQYALKLISAAAHICCLIFIQYDWCIHFLLLILQSYCNLLLWVGGSLIFLLMSSRGHYLPSQPSHWC